MVGSRGALALCVVALPLAAGCSLRESVLARVGKHKVETEAFQNYLTAVTGQSWETVNAQVATRLLDQFLDQEVVAAAARVTRDIRIPIEPGARSERVRALMAEVCGPAPAPPVDEVEKEVARQLATSRPPQAHVRQLLFASEQAATAAHKRLQSGADFAALSAEVSLAPNAERAGEIGLLYRGALPPDLESVIFALAPGHFSLPVQSPAGYHIFQVLDAVPAGPPPRTEVERDVKRTLAEQSARAFTRHCLGRLAREVGVSVLKQRLWFQYDGRYASGGGDDVG